MGSHRVALAQCASTISEGIGLGRGCWEKKEYECGRGRSAKRETAKCQGSHQKHYTCEKKPLIGRFRNSLMFSFFFKTVHFLNGIVQFTQKVGPMPRE